MADISSVENALISLLMDTVYPFGVDQPSIFGSTCRIYRGWPNTTTLNNDLRNDIINVTVVSDNDSGRLTTRYLPKFQTLTQSPGVSIHMTGGTIVIGGQPKMGDLVGVAVDDVGFSYRVQARDTIEMVAANIAHIIQQTRPVTLSGSSLSVPGAYRVIGRTCTDGTTLFEARRQEKDCRVISWCSSPEIRDTVCLSVDAALSDFRFLPLSDGSFARFTYKNTASFDQAQDALLYRRDLVFTAEYPTVSSIAQPSMLFGDSALNGNITTG